MEKKVPKAHKYFSMKRIMLFVGVIVVAFIIIVIVRWDNQGELGKLTAGPDPWRSVRNADVAVVTPEWNTPTRVAVSSGGWEDGAFISPNSQRLYFAYYPGEDLLKDLQTGQYADDLDVYVSNYPFKTKQKFSDYFLSEDIWSEGGMQITSSGDVFYNSSRDYVNDQNPDDDIYKNDQRLAMNDTLGSTRSWGNPHYCAVRDELWFSESDSDLYVLTNASAGGFAGTPTLAPAPLQVEDYSSFQPWLSEDCNTIIFTSNRGDVPGPGPAIYRSTRAVNGTWSSPVPIVYSQVGVGEGTRNANGDLYFIQLFKNANGDYTSDIFVAKRR